MIYRQKSLGANTLTHGQTDVHMDGHRHTDEQIALLIELLSVSGRD